MGLRCAKCEGTSEQKPISLACDTRYGNELNLTFLSVSTRRYYFTGSCVSGVKGMSSVKIHQECQKQNNGIEVQIWNIPLHACTIYIDRKGHRSCAEEMDGQERTGPISYMHRYV